MNIFILFTFLSLSLATDNLKIYILNVGQADSQLLVYPSGYTILIDAGENEGDSSATNAKYISKRIQEITGGKTIDVLVLTHIHIDHHGGYNKGGIWYLIEKEGITFKKFISRDMGTYNGEKFSNCKASTIDWKYMGQGTTTAANFVCYATSTKETTKLSKIREIADVCSKTQINPPDENAEVEILMSDALGCKDTAGNVINDCEYDKDGSPNENDFSICLRITYGKFVYSTCGDLSGNEYQHNEHFYHDIESVVAPMMGEVDLYHVNHHGSKSATNANWCNTLKPTVAVFSCGEDSSAGHPATAPLKNLNAVSAEMYLTNNCNSANTDSYNVHIMSDDVVVSVPKDGTKFIVAKPDGSSSTVYDIKTDKPERTACKKLA